MRARDLLVVPTPASVYLAGGPSPAAANPGNLDVFDLRGSATQNGWLAEFLAACTFDFRRLAPGLAKAGRPKVAVTFEPMSGGTGGWADTAGNIAVNSRLAKTDAQAVFGMESFHAVDFFLPEFTDAVRRQIIAIFHPDGPDRHEWFGRTSYFDQIGEAYTTLAVWAFSAWRPDPNNYTHVTTGERARALAALLGATGPAVPPVPPTPVPPPPPPPPAPPPPPPPHGGWLHELLDLIFGRHGGPATAGERAAVAAIPVGVLGTLLPLLIRYAAAVVPVVRAGIAAGKPWPAILADVLAAVAAAG